MTDDSGVSRRLKKHPCQGILTGVLFLVLYESVVDIVNGGMEASHGVFVFIPFHFVRLPINISTNIQDPRLNILNTLCYKAFKREFVRRMPRNRNGYSQCQEERHPVFRRMPLRINRESEQNRWREKRRQTVGQEWRGSVSTLPYI